MPARRSPLPDDRQCREEPKGHRLDGSKPGAESLRVAQQSADTSAAPMPDARSVGAEELLRLRRPSRALLSPALSLRALEAGETCLDAGRWTVGRARTVAADVAARRSPVRVAVDLCAAQLAEADLFGDAAAALALAEVPGDTLEFEIIGITVPDLDESAAGRLRGPRARDIGGASDDCGIGHASPSLPKRDPPARPKIDRTPVRGIGTDPDAAVVWAVTALGAGLDRDVIAEGIETAERASALAAHGRPQARAHRSGEPMPAEPMPAEPMPAEPMPAEAFGRLPPAPPQGVAA